MGAERITLNMTVQDSIVALAEGNPGALTVCINILKQAKAIDPQGAMVGLGPILSLDTHGIYGPRIWMLYKDVCGQDMPKMLAALRSVQLGIVPESTLIRAIDNNGEGFDPDEALRLVQARLPGFQAPLPVEA